MNNHFCCGLVDSGAGNLSTEFGFPGSLSFIYALALRKAAAIFARKIKLSRWFLDLKMSGRRARDQLNSIYESNRQAGERASPI